MKKFSKIVQLLLFYLGVIIIWQLVYYAGAELFGWWKAYAFPNPYGVYKSCVRMIEQKTLIIAIVYSVRRAFIGYGISLLAGFIVGYGMSKHSFFKNNLKSLLLGIQALPSICWVPFAILLFGLDDSAILFVIVIGTTSSIAISVMSAFSLVNPIYIKVAKTMGVSNSKLYYKVIIPASVPMLIAGLRQGWSFAWRALMAGEVISATVGLGQALTMGRDLADINRVTFLMIVIVIIGTLIDTCFFSTIEKSVKKKRGLL